MHFPRRSLMAGLAMTAALAAATPAAFADTTTTTVPTGSRSAATLSALQAKAAAAVSERIASLNTAVSDVTANEYLAAVDRSTILATLNGDLSGLTAVGQKIASDSTVAAARADYTTVFTTFRVYALALPQARLAESADELTGTAVPRFTDAQSRLAALLAGPAKQKADSQTAAAMSDLAAQISAITSDTNGVAASVLADTPAGWNANHGLLTGSQSQLKGARTAAHQAHADIVTVVDTIR